MTIRSDSTRQRVSGADPRRPRTVVSRQGQVLRDVDLDEQARLQLDRIEIETRDVLGPPDRLMVRAGNDGFRVQTGGGFSLGAGRGYLGGWLLENAAACNFTSQPHPRPAEALGARAVVAVKALVRHIDSAEEAAWADVALGDAQSSGRSLNDWQAFVFVPDVGGALSCADLLARPDWQKLVQPSSGQLAIVPQQAAPSTNPCSLTPGGGYARLENLLYRIEVDGGTPRNDYPQVDGPRFGLDGLRLKFSRRNASVLARIVNVAGSAFKVAAPPLDPANWFAPGSFAEIVSLHDDLDPRPAIAAKRLFKVASAVDSDITLEATGGEITATKVAADGTWFLRLWDAFPDGEGLAAAMKQGNESAVIDLGDGLGFKLAGGAAATFRRGDYWLIPARADASLLDWPVAGGVYQPQGPHGPETRYAPLAVIGGIEASPEDCRVPFASLSDRALFYRGGDGQNLFPNGASAGFVELPGRLRVAALRGETPVPNALIVWSAPAGAPASQVNGQPVGGANTVTVKTDAAGLAEVKWAIDAAKLHDRHSVQAGFASGPGASDPPIVFAAAFETARDTAYEPGQCKHLLTVNNVQDAIDRLCKELDRKHDCLGLTEINIGGGQAAKIKLIQKDLILNGAVIPAESLADGIVFNFDRSPLGIAPQSFDPVVEIELDLPYPTTDFDRRYWALQTMGAAGGLTGPFGFFRMRLDGEISVRSDKETRGDLVWQPSGPAQTFLRRLAVHQGGQRVFDPDLAGVLPRRWPQPLYDRLLCGIRLRSALIWAGEGDERIYLNAEHLGTRERATGSELLLRRRDDQSAADLDMFVYLQIPQIREPADPTRGNVDIRDVKIGTKIGEVAGAATRTDGKP